jgi:hypothetical protein
MLQIGTSELPGQMNFGLSSFCMRDHDLKCFCGKPGLNISLTPFDRDERLMEVERILALIMKSRTGVGGCYTFVEDRYYVEAAVQVESYDLTPAGMFFGKGISSNLFCAAKVQQDG